MVLTDLYLGGNLFNYQCWQYVSLHAFIKTTISLLRAFGYDPFTSKGVLLTHYPPRDLFRLG